MFFLFLFLSICSSIVFNIFFSFNYLLSFLHIHTFSCIFFKYISAFICCLFAFFLLFIKFFFLMFVLPFLSLDDLFIFILFLLSCDS